MSTRILTMTALATLFFTCTPKPPIAEDHKDLRINAANQLTDRYTHSRLAAWNVRAAAAGADCDVVLLTTSIILEDSMVDALHYGAGAYAVYDGGVQRFCRDRSFRGAAYKDASGRIWAYGGITAAQATTLRTCD